MKLSKNLAISVVALIGVLSPSAWGKNLRVSPLVKDTPALAESIVGVDSGALDRLRKDPPAFADTSEKSSPSSVKKKDTPTGVVESESIAEGGDSDPSTKDPPKEGAKLDTKNNDHYGLLLMSKLKASLLPNRLEADSVYGDHSEESAAVLYGRRRLGQVKDLSEELERTRDKKDRLLDDEEAGQGNAEELEELAKEIEHLEEKEIHLKDKIRKKCEANPRPRACKEEEWWMTEQNNRT